MNGAGVGMAEVYDFMFNVPKLALDHMGVCFVIVRDSSQFLSAFERH